MNAFLNYLDQDMTLEQRVANRFDELGIAACDRADAMAFLGLLEVKDAATYEHSLRVGLLASDLGAFMHLDARALFYSGLLHDVGKSQVRLSTLQKTIDWTPADAEEVKSHVVDGHRLLRDRFDFTSEVILWHHRFQPNHYPVQMPVPIRAYSEGTRVMIPFFGRLLSLADVFDALHRVNDRHGTVPPTGEGIRERMIELNPDQRTLIREAYEAGIFTTRIVAEAAVAATN